VVQTKRTGPPLAKDPRSLRDPRLGDPPPADEGRAGAPILPPVHGGVPQPGRPRPSGRGRCAAGLGGSGLLPAGAEPPPAGPDRDRDRSPHPGNGARRAPWDRALHRGGGGLDRVRGAGRGGGWECAAGPCAPVRRGGPERPLAAGYGGGAPRSGGSPFVEPGDDGARGDRVHAEGSPLRLLPRGGVLRGEERRGSVPRSPGTEAEVGPSDGPRPARAAGVRPGEA